MKTAFSYIRWSNPSQSEGDSLRRQLELTQKWCDSNGYTLSTARFRDSGRSAWKAISNKGERVEKRTGLLTMLDAIQSGTISRGDCIVVESLDRLSRKGFFDTTDRIKEIIATGVDVYCLSEDLFIKAGTVEDDIVLIKLMFAAGLAKRESDKKSERIRQAKRAALDKMKAGQAVPRRLPQWISYQDGKYVLNERAEHVRLMVRSRLAGHGLHHIAGLLNDQGISTAFGRASWSYTVVSDIIKNEALFGRFWYGSIDYTDNGNWKPSAYIDDFYPALITREEWESIQPKVTAKVGGRRDNNRLAMLVRCGKCDGAMMITEIEKAGVLYKYWRCVNSTSKACDMKALIPSLDDVVLRFAGELVVSTGDGLAMRRKAILDDLGKQREIWDNIKLSMRGGKALAMLIEAAGEVEDKISQLTAELNGLKSTDEADVKRIGEVWGDVRQANMALRKVIRNVVVINRGKNTWSVKVNQLNKHWIGITMFRKGQRSEWKYACTRSVDIQKLVDEAEEFDWEWE